MSVMLLEPREFRLLDGLRLNPRKSFGGKVRGERLTKKKGVSIEFDDYREYAEGDDLRHLDWNVLARLDAPVMRTYRDEEDLALYVLLDSSASMGFGEPTKYSAASKFCCAMAYVALNGGDAVVPRILGRKEANPITMRGRANYPRVVAWVTQSRDLESSSVGLTASLRAFAAQSARAGVVLIVSDGLDPDIASALRILGGRGHEVLFLQILSDVEIDPDIEGDLRLLDAETGRATEVTANSYVLKEYRRRLQEHNQSIVDVVRRIGGRYALVRPDQAIDEVLQHVLKREGWVK